jgi:hypothetical protein
MKSSIYDCVILPLNKVHNRAGNITVVEGRKMFLLMLSVFIIYMIYLVEKTVVHMDIKN